MKISIKDISLYIIIAFIINLSSHLLKNKYLITYLIDNLITIQVALLAINTATSGLIISKLQDVKLKRPEANLKPITKSLLLSLKEQIFLIGLSILFIIIKDSKITETLSYSHYFDFFIETIIITAFIYSIDILWDTGKSIFILIDIIDDIK